jgi:hypothetical protein
MRKKFSVGVYGTGQRRVSFRCPVFDRNNLMGKTVEIVNDQFFILLKDEKNCLYSVIAPVKDDSIFDEKICALREKGYDVSIEAGSIAKKDEVVNHWKKRDWKEIDVSSFWQNNS